MSMLNSQLSSPKVACALPEAWLETATGRQLHKLERNCIDKLVEDFQGYYALQIGNLSKDMLVSSPINTKIRAGRSKLCDVQVDYPSLPFASAELDLVVISHALEFSTEPEAIVRESFRCLRPEGQIIIIGFSPAGLYGLRYALDTSGDYPWHGEFIMASRVRDWLKVLGFTMRSGYCLGFAPPWLRGEWPWMRGVLENAGRRWWPLLGGVYVMQAVKRVPAMKLVQVPWKRKSKERAMPVSVAEKSSGTIHRS